MSAPRLSLAYPRLWRPTTVPTFPVALDRSHPLARGLALSIVPGSSRGAVDFVNGLSPVVTGTGYVAAGARGPGYATNVNGVLGYAQAVAPPVFSMEVLVQTGTPGTRNEFICGWDSASGGGGGLNDRSITGFGGGVTGSFEGYIFPGSAVTVVGGTTFFAGLISHVVMTSDGTTLALYVNGVSVASTAAGNAYAGYSNPSYFVVGSNDRTSWPWSGTIQLANVATVAWTSSEIAARYAEPFGMFRPIVRRQYFVGTAGGTSFTATPGAGAVTLTGLQPAVSAAAALTPGVGSVAFTGLQPTVSIGSNFTAAPGVGAVAFAGMAPAVAADAAALPSVGSIIYTGAAPTVATSTDVTALPGVGSVVLTGFAPTVTQSDINLTPGVGTVLLTGYQPTVTASPIIVPSVGGFDAGGFGKWYNTAFTTSSSSSERRARDSELGQMLDRLVYRDDVADIRADAEPEAAAEIVRAAVTEIKRSRYEINDEFDAIDRVKAQQTAYHALMRRRTEEESQRAFIAAVVEQSAHDQRKRHRIMRDDEDMMALFELAI